MRIATGVWRVRIGAVCCLLAPLLVGCQGTWEAFEGIEVGKPVPKAGLFDKSARKGSFVWEWRDNCFVGFPPFAAMSSVRTVHDSNGDVVAKEYKAEALGYWLLMQTCARRSVIETRVPDHAWHDPPVQRKPFARDDRAARRREKLTGVLGALLREAKGHTLRYATGSGGRDSLEGDRASGVYAGRITPHRVAKRIRDQIDDGNTSVIVDVGKDIDLDGIVGAEEIDWSDVLARVYVVKYAPNEVALFLEIGMPVAPRPATNVLEWLRVVLNVKDRRLPKYQKASGSFPEILEPIYLCSLISAMRLGDLGNMPRLFRGVTQEGFDRTYRNAWGATCRIQNLGDRRLRVEMNHLEMGDGLMVMVFLKWTLAQ